jgi:hypothetical protein
MTDGSTATPDHIDDGVFQGWVIGFWRPHGLTARIALTLSVLVCAVILYLGSQWFGVPELPGFDGSLLRQSSPAMAIILVAILMPIAALVGTVLAGAVRFEAGLFAAALGLMCISLRTGTMTSVLQEANGQPDVYKTLAVELLMLSIILIGVWGMLWVLGKKTVINAEHHDGAATGSQSNGIGALITQAIVTALVMLFFCQSEAKYQVLASVGISSVIGTWIAYTSFPARPSIWYWTAPLLVGIIAYILAAMNTDPNLMIGHPDTLLGALERPLPLDYASAGPAGAILGYWTMRKKTTT